MALAKVKVQPLPKPLSPSSSSRQVEGDAPLSPNKMVPVYQNLNGTADKGEARVPGLTVRPTRVHTNTFPHNATYNPYDLGALLADFKLKQSASPSAGAAPPPPQFTGSRVVNRSFSYNGPAVAKRSPFMSAAAAAKPSSAAVSKPAVAPPQPQEHKTEGLVMIPGMRRVNTT
jgi:hypothetical protein